MSKEKYYIICGKFFDEIVEELKEDYRILIEGGVLRKLAGV